VYEQDGCPKKICLVTVGMDWTGAVLREKYVSVVLHDARVVGVGFIVVVVHTGRQGLSLSWSPVSVVAVTESVAMSGE
jgi:hypothetical protein